MILKPARHGKKSALLQAIEIARLKRSTTKLALSEYYWFALFDQDIYRSTNLSAFCGSYMKNWLHKEVNSQLWDAVVTDKYIMSIVFDRAGIPHPKTYAVACRFPRNCGTVPVFTSSPDLCEFFRNKISYPFFCKPIKGGSAKGASRVESYDRESDAVTLANGKVLGVDLFVQSLVDTTGWGFIFQEAVTAHPQTVGICGEAVSGCRIVMLLDDVTAYPIWITWKLPAGKNFADNFVHGQTGNLLADINLETGVAKRVVSGSGLSLQINPCHPDTGTQILGQKLPDWENLNRQMQIAALAFPGFRLQHWDVGLTSRGPVVYELNTAGDLDLLQLSRGSGFYDESLRRFLSRIEKKGRRTTFAGAPVATR